MTTTTIKDKYYEEAMEQVRDLYGHNNTDLTEFMPFLRAFYELSDHEGFCVDFDLWWKAAGYKQKGHAKDWLIGRRGRLGLKECIDYKVEVNKSAFATAGVTTVPPRIQNGGQNKETITLTYRTAGQLALAAQTRQGTILRDAVLQLVAANKRFKRALDRGDIEIRSNKRKTSSNNSRDHKRLKVCESQKTLMQEVASVAISGKTFARINGETNLAVTGRYAYQTAKLLGKKKINARDHMTDSQLVLAEAAETLTQKILREQGGDPEKVHKSVLKRIETACELTRGEVAEQKRDLKSIRQDIKMIKDKLEQKPTAKPKAKPLPAIPKLKNTIQKYLS